MPLVTGRLRRRKSAFGFHLVTADSGPAAQNPLHHRHRHPLPRGRPIPSPGVNYPNVQQCIAEVSGGDSGQVYSLINLFSGGALLQLSVFAVGIMPYITASIIVQLLTVVIPRFEQLRKEGQAGQTKMTQYTRYLSIALALLQSTSIVALAANGGLLQGCTLDIIQGQSDGLNIFTLVVMVLVMTAGPRW